MNGMTSPLISKRKPTVLIVDDNDDTRRFMYRLISKANYRVITAENGKAGVEAFQNHNPDIVLLDVMMPVMDGYEACKFIRQMPNGKRVPILIITSLDDKESIQAAYEVGATDYIAKPLQSLILQNRVTHWISAYRAETALAERLRIVEQINNVLQTAASSLDMTEILRSVVQVVTDGLQLTSGYASEYDAKTRTIVPIVEYFSPRAKVPSDYVSDLGKATILADNSLLASLFDNPPRFVLIHSDDPSLSQAEKDYYHKYNVKTLLLLPIRANEQLVGFLHLWDTHNRHDLEDFETNLAVEIARRVGTAIYNAQLHHALLESEKRLRSYAAELEERNQDLDAYGHTIAHDMRNPLTMIINYTELIMEEDGKMLSEASNQFLERIKVRSTEMSDMVQRLLELAGMKDTSEAIEPLEILPLAQAIADRYTERLQSHNIQLHLPDTIPTLMGNETWVKEVLDNLLGNAIKYMRDEKDGHWIKIYAVADGDQTRICVEDNGIGIKLNGDKDSRQLFEPTFRRDTSKFQGFGLGLAIVQRLVQRMGGSVGVESELGKGSTFWFSLPNP